VIHVPKNNNPKRLELEVSFVSTMWKFQDFSVTLILREINFGEFKSSKTAVFAIELKGL